MSCRRLIQLLDFPGFTEVFLLPDPGVGHLDGFRDNRQIVTTIGRRVFELLLVSIAARHGDGEPAFSSLGQAMEGTRFPVVLCRSWAKSRNKPTTSGNVFS